jgi:hypothetical protein
MRHVARRPINALHEARMVSVIPVLVALSTALAATAAPKDGEELIRQMHDRYAGKWYRTLTFVQKR